MDGDAISSIKAFGKSKLLASRLTDTDILSHVQHSFFAVYRL